MAKRKHIKSTTEKLLWAMSAGRCEKCGRLIYKHPLSNAVGNFAQIAHNLPVSENGPRAKFKAIDPLSDINDVNNLLLLCYDCHKEVDEVCPEKYPPYLLKQIKNNFEEFVVKATNVERTIPTFAIKYSPNLHGQRLQIIGIQKALFPDKYIKNEADLTLNNSAYFVDDSNYWEIEETNLVRSFNQKVVPIIENYKDGFINISVFALAPIPLLIKLGELLSNKNNIDVYQLKKSPISSWEWEVTSDDTDYRTTYIQEFDNPEKIILILSLSGKIKHNDVKNATAWNEATVVEVEPNHKQYDDYLRNKKQLDKFVLCYQLLKEELRNKCESKTSVHIFAAVPVSVAIEIGRHRNRTVDLPLVLYNYTNGKYEKVLTIGDKNE